MRKRKWAFHMNQLSFITIVIGLTFMSFHNGNDPNWGFFGHRKINKYAIYTLPEPMLPLYKKYIGYLEEHAVDPDKRRYASKYEAIRHYIDLDQWGSYPFQDLPKKFNEALAKHSILKFIEGNDSILIHKKINKDSVILTIRNQTYKTSIKQYHYWVSKNIMPIYYEDEWVVNINDTSKIGNLDQGKILMIDTFSQHGIVPYYLPIALNRLTRAFEDGNVEMIIRQSAEIGHYIGDAHVPLHTTKNYNGQLTNQVGIHAFWESRLPELFSEKQYDFFAGKAEFVEKPQDYFWNIILESHSYLNQVLEIEKQLSIDFPTDQQFCYDSRLGQTIRIQCEDYSKAYHEALDGMVEERMVKAIKSIGDIWYTAWTNAGSPDLNEMMKKTSLKEIKTEEIKYDPNIKTREHEGQ